jgi:protein-L-isoaspartate O-methyltransferase
MNGNEAAAFRDRMVGRLLDRDHVPDGWERELAAVPRHVFAPEVVWLPTARGWLPWRGADDPRAWLELVHSDDERLVAQVDDGTPDGAGRYPTSTVLAPSEVLWLLGSAGARPGGRSCVVGAGLGWTTALLAARLGADSVCAVETDPGLAAQCLRRLDSVGLGGVEVLVGDGSRELPAGPAFDVLLSTVTVRHVPGEWLRRVRPGGTIVTGFGTEYRHEPVVRLTVEAGCRAVGHVVGELACEWERGQRVRPRLATPDLDVITAGAAGTTFDVARLPDTHDAAFAIGVRLPGCRRVRLAADDHWYLDPGTGSRAHWHRLPFGRLRVDQYGPRRLWDELQAAHRWWVDAGRPPACDWTVTATPAGTTARPPAMATAG